MRGQIASSKNKKMSRLKRIIVRERADKAVALASQAASQAAASAAAAKQAHMDLTRDMQACFGLQALDVGSTHTCNSVEDEKVCGLRQQGEVEVLVKGERNSTGTFRQHRLMRIRLGRSH